MTRITSFVHDIRGDVYRALYAKDRTPTKPRTVASLAKQFSTTTLQMGRVLFWLESECLIWQVRKNTYAGNPTPEVDMLEGFARK